MKNQFLDGADSVRSTQKCSSCKFSALLNPAMKFGVGAARSAAPTPNFMAQISNANFPLVGDVGAGLAINLAVIQRLTTKPAPTNRANQQKIYRRKMFNATGWMGYIPFQKPAHYANLKSILEKIMYLD